MLGWPRFFSLFLTCVIAAPECFAKLVNFTIDDTYQDRVRDGKIVYGPRDSWAIGDGPNCPRCSPKSFPGDPEEWGITSGPMNGTWHSNQDLGGFPPQIEVTFNGSAIYLYGLRFWYSTMRVVFELDGVLQPQNYTYQGRDNPMTDPTQWKYDELVYSKTGLTPGVHKVVATNQDESVFSFDYAVYSAEEPDSTSGSSSPAPTSTQSGGESGGLPVGAIVGIVAGIVAFIAVTVVTSLLYFRRRYRRRSTLGTIDSESRAAASVGDYPSIMQARPTTVLTSTTSAPSHTTHFSSPIEEQGYGFGPIGVGGVHTPPAYTPMPGMPVTSPVSRSKS